MHLVLIIFIVRLDELFDYYCFSCIKILVERKEQKKNNTEKTLQAKQKTKKLNEQKYVTIYYTIYGSPPFSLSSSLIHDLDTFHDQMQLFLIIFAHSYLQCIQFTFSFHFFRFSFVFDEMHMEKAKQEQKLHS